MWCQGLTFLLGQLGRGRRALGLHSGLRLFSGRAQAESSIGSCTLASPQGEPSCRLI